MQNKLKLFSGTVVMQGMLCPLLALFAVYGQDTEVSSPPPVVETVAVEAMTIETVVEADQGWQSVGVDVELGDQVVIAYMFGDWRSNPDDPLHGPDGGTSYVCRGEDCVEPVSGFPKGGLIGRIGEDKPFAVGDHVEFVAETGGSLQLRMNDTDLSDNEGSLLIEVTVISPPQDTPE